MTNIQRIHRRLLAALFTVLIGALAVGTAAHADDTTPSVPVPQHQPDWYQNRAEITFTEYLIDTQGSSTVSPGPYCSVSEDYQTASCQAEVDGVIQAWVGTLSEPDEGYFVWLTAESVAASAAVDAATSPEEAFTVDAGAAGHTLTDVECAVHEQPYPYTEYICHGTTPNPDGANFKDLRWAGTVVEYGGNDRSVYSDIVDDLLANPYSFGESNPDIDNTVLTIAAQECIDMGGGEVSAYDLQFADRGHAVGVSDEDDIECLLGVLGLPTWPYYALVTAPLYFEGFGMMVALDSDGGYGGLVIFDDTVAPQH